MTAWLTTNLIANALLPPLSLILLLFTGLLLHRRRPALAMSLILLSIVALYTLSTPWIGGLLLKTLEISRPLAPGDLENADAIVVLGGGRRIGAAEYGEDTANGITLERLRHAARLARESGLPILVTGGKPGGGTLAEGEIMRRILHVDYGIDALWVEDAALTTWDNARLSDRLLNDAGIHRIALVTHAWHLRRAVPLFESRGFTVLPAGTQFARTRVNDVFDLIPSPAGLRDSTFALHEWLGILWYKLRTQFSQGTA